MIQFSYDLCELMKFWFTETSYEGKKLYALHRILYDKNIGRKIEKITNLGENMQEVKRLNDLFITNKSIVKYTYIIWTPISLKVPVYMRDEKGLLICGTLGNPVLYHIYNYPLECYKDDFGFQRLSREKPQNDINYMLRTGRWIRAVSLPNGQYKLPQNLPFIQSYKTRILDNKELI